jgi:chaperonin cofactor prefoldin
MVEYMCAKCNKSFDRKSNYLTHVNRKFACNANNNRIERIEKVLETLQKENEQLKTEITELKNNLNRTI